MDLYEMDVRQYDPAIARWTGIDPVTHHSMSTYNAFDNNPVFWADPSGADAGLSQAVSDHSGGNASAGNTLDPVDAVEQEESKEEDSNGEEASTAPEVTICDDCAKCPETCNKSKSKSKPVKEMSAGEFYGMAYNGYSLTAYLNGNDPYNPTEADIAQSDRERAEAGLEFVLFVSGEYAVVKILQGGVRVLRLVKVSKIAKSSGRVFYVGENAETLARSIASEKGYKTIYDTWYGMIGQKVTPFLTQQTSRKMWGNLSAKFANGARHGDEIITVFGRHRNTGLHTLPINSQAAWKTTEFPILDLKGFQFIPRFTK